MLDLTHLQFILFVVEYRGACQEQSRSHWKEVSFIRQFLHSPVLVRIQHYPKPDLDPHGDGICRQGCHVPFTTARTPLVEHQSGIQTLLEHFYHHCPLGVCACDLRPVLEQGKGALTCFFFNLLLGRQFLCS